MTLVDTSLFIDAQRGSALALQRLLEVLEDPDDVCLSAMTVLELTAGRKTPRRWLDWYERIFRAVTIVPVDEEAARLGAGYARLQAANGRKLHNSDAAIAGCAARAGAGHLVASDADFEGLPFRVETVRVN